MGDEGHEPPRGDGSEAGASRVPWHGKTELLAAALDNLQLGVLLADEERRVLHVNPKFCELMGLRSPAVVVGQGPETSARLAREIVANPDRFVRRVDEILDRRRLVRGEDVELANGRILERDYVPLFVGGDYVGHLWQYRDVTDRRREERELRTYVRVLESMVEGVCVTDDQETILWTNPAFDAMFGYERGELVRQHVRVLGDRFAEEAEDKVAQVHEALRTAGEWRGEFANVRKDGTALVTSARIGRLRLGERECWVSVQEDVTARKQADEALRRQQASFRELIESLPDLVVVTRQGRIVHMNRTGVQKLGYETLDDLRGRPLADVVHPDDRSASAERVGRAVRWGRPVEWRELRLWKKDGSALLAEVVSLPVVFDGESSVLGVGRDVTERRAMQDRLAVADRLASMGMLAAGVAHEINNPLAAVVASLEYAAESIDRAGAGADGARGDLRAAVEAARDGAERIRRIVQDLRAFSRSPDDVRLAVDLHRVLDGCIDLAWNEIRHRARLVKDYGPIPAIAGNPSRLGQVFLNLIVNAAQAITEGDASRHEIRVSTRTDPAEGVVVEVRDTGCGIPPEHLGRVFDPFFTTKPVGVGTGLGLSICHGIVRSMGGTISAESRSGEGSTFRVCLPVREAVEEAPEPETPRRGPPSGRRGRVLVVDDDALVLAAIRRLLGRDHEVVAVERGDEARDRLLGDERFDAVLCDVMMPEMTGMDLYGVVTSARPDLGDRFVFMTGGAFTQAAREFLDRVPNRRLDKPFDARSLRELLRKMVG